MTAHSKLGVVKQRGKSLSYDPFGAFDGVPLDPKPNR